MGRRGPRCQLRWDSLGRIGASSLHWATILMSPSIVVYVLVHELTHPREPNHTRPSSGGSYSGCCPTTRRVGRGSRRRGWGLHCNVRSGLAARPDNVGTHTLYVSHVRDWGYEAYALDLWWTYDPDLR